MSKRIALPRIEAAALIEGAVHSAMEDYNLGAEADFDDGLDIAGVECHGLFRWSPDGWSAHTDKPLQGHFFWVYEVLFSSPSLDPVDHAHAASVPRWFLLGTGTKGGNECFVPDSSDAVLDEWGHDYDEMLEGMVPATSDHLEAAGLSAVQILGMGL